MDQLRSDVAHLYRRFGWSLRAAELDALVARGSYEAVVDELFSTASASGANTAGDAPANGGAAPSFIAPTPGGQLDVAARQAQQKTLRQEAMSTVVWWLQRMVSGQNALVEKITWFWHGHFATSIDKVKDPALMYAQNELLRAKGLGPFTDLVQAVAKDPAMLVWLDSNTNVKSHPNENFARELLELFTLGIGHYSEDDVKQAARAFTGWAFDKNTGAFAFRPRQHDDGSKTVLGSTGDLGGEDVIRIATAKPESARFIAQRAWSHFAYPVDASDGLLDALAAHVAPSVELRELFRAIALHPQFRSDAARAGLVKQPVEYVVGAWRALAIQPDNDAVAALRALGQVPFEPPSVGGWPQNQYWINTASALIRLQFALGAARKGDLSSIVNASIDGRADAVARLLTVDGWSPATLDALQAVRSQPQAMVAMAMVSPEYVMN